MAAESLKPVYLLTGSDRPKVARAVERLRGHFDTAAVEMLWAEDVSGEDAVAACNALGLFGEGRRLVVVEDVERWKAEDAKVIASYLTDPAPETVLALVAGELKKDSPLAKACAKAGDVLVYDVTKRELPRWVAEQFARLGAKVTPEACRALVGLVGENLDELVGEIDKLATWAAGEEIGEEAIGELVAGRADTPPFVLTDAWGRRDVAAALAACESILERSRRDELPKLVGQLAAHVRRVQACRRLDEEGVRPRDAAVRLRMHPFVAEKAFAHARNFSAEELQDAIVRLARLDLATKGGTRLPDELELERALIEITRPAGAPAR